MTPPLEDRPPDRPPAEDRPRRRLRAVAPDPAPNPATDHPAPDPASQATRADAAAGPRSDKGVGGGAAPADLGREGKKGKRRNRRGRRGRGGAAAADVAAAPGAAPQPARLRPRHLGALVGFLLLVALPFGAATAYLFSRAADQFHSEVAFSVRSEEMGSATAGLLGALTQIGGGAPDAAILYAYIRSQEIVEAIDDRLDLRAIWNRPGAGWRDGDPVFALGADPTIEALHREWLRMVTVSYDTSAGIIDITARAFTPADAQAIAKAVLAESGALVNQLADQAREDAVRFADEELAEAEAHLAEVRGRLGDFRREHSLVDPSADVAGQSGLLNALNAELAQALVDRDVLTSYAAEGDQRVLQTDRRIAAITERIQAERATLGVTGVAGSLPEVVGRYEELAVDLEFANQAYTQALAGVAAARAEARRQARYLAAHVRPTEATTSLYPRRLLLAGLAGLFLLLGWGILMLVYYNVRDSR